MCQRGKSIHLFIKIQRTKCTIQKQSLESRTQFEEEERITNPRDTFTYILMFSFCVQY